MTAEQAASLEGFRPVGWRRALIWGVFVVLLCMKAPDALTVPQFWAEDASVFFAGQWTTDGPQVLAPYAGYLHVVPRLVAWILSSVPTAVMPLAYNLAAIIIAASALCYAATGLHRDVPWMWWAVGVLALPTAGDVYGSLTNVQWFGQFAIVAATFRAPCDRGTSHRLASFVAPHLGRAALLAWCLSGPFALLWLATLGSFLVFCRARGGSALFAAVGGRIRLESLVTVAVGAVIQGAVLLGQPIGTPEAQSNLPPSAYWALVQGVTPAAHSYSVIVNAPWTAAHLALLAVYGLALVWLCVTFVWRPSPPRGVLVMLALFGAAQPLLAYAKQLAPHTLASPSHYFFALGLAVVLALGQWVGARHLSRILLLGLIASAGVMGVFRPEYVRRAPLANLDWPYWSARLDTRTACLLVPVNPPRWHARFQQASTHLDCR